MIYRGLKLLVCEQKENWKHSFELPEIIPVYSNTNNNGGIVFLSPAGNFWHILPVFEFIYCKYMLEFIYADDIIDKYKYWLVD